MRYASRVDAFAQYTGRVATSLDPSAILFRNSDFASILSCNLRGAAGTAERPSLCDLADDRKVDLPRAGEGLRDAPPQVSPRRAFG
jgi:hypothetical protein